MEKDDVKLNLETLELNGIPIVEIMDFDPDATQEEFAAAFRQKAEWLRSLNLLSWPERAEDRIFGGSAGEYRVVKNPLVIEGSWHKKGRHMELKIHMDETVVLAPELVPGKSKGKKALKELQWEVEESKDLDGIVSRYIDGTQVLVNFTKATDSFIRFMRMYKKEEDGGFVLYG